MRKLMLSALIAATVLPSAAYAQSAREVRRDNREVQEARRDLQNARMRGDRRDAREAREDLRDARQERREDWRDYRRTNRDVFRMGRYNAPRGLTYRPARVGVTLNRGFYGRNYWIADPYRYRLPRVSGFQRWVRYGSDVLLVDIRNGRVLQVNNGFFW